ncbi:hypothetical protein BZG36_03870 [Bifiguratus adelaidae]|uniref:SPX domain-containing protein n=1 Tax=Bifiguratus adelaidae TaxID=1938954 RepID=A0A261XXP6_9FUNG|nr:hypothetical protein BZG36_03870 [Bifiguratus adelaidae]
MKFGQYVKRQRHADYRFYYIDYDKLKKACRETTASGQAYNQDQVDALASLLREEMEKVSSFHKLKLAELSHHLEQVSSAIYGPFRPLTPTSSAKHAFNVPEMDKVAYQIQEFWRYTQLNTRAVHKIHKKFARWAGRRVVEEGYKVEGEFGAWMNEEAFEELMIELGRVYAYIRSHTQFRSISDLRQLSNNTLTPSNDPYHRQLSKIHYVFNPDNLLDLQLYLLKYMSLQLPDSFTERQAIRRRSSSASNLQAMRRTMDASTNAESRTSVCEAVQYLDTTTLDMYDHHLASPDTKTNFVDLVRSSSEPQLVTVLTSTRAENHCTQDVFAIKYKHAHAWLRKEWDANKSLQDKKMRGKIVNPGLERAVQDGQRYIWDQDLVAVVEGIRSRTTFTEPRDSNVAVHLDTGIHFLALDQATSEHTPLDLDVLHQAPTTQGYLSIPWSVMTVVLEDGVDEPDFIPELAGMKLVRYVADYDEHIHALSIAVKKPHKPVPRWLSVLHSTPPILTPRMQPYKSQITDLALSMTSSTATNESTTPSTPADREYEEHVDKANPVDERSRLLSGLSAKLPSYHAIIKPEQMRHPTSDLECGETSRRDWLHALFGRPCSRSAMRYAFTTTITACLACLFGGATMAALIFLATMENKA